MNFISEIPTWLAKVSRLTVLDLEGMRKRREKEIRRRRKRRKRRTKKMKKTKILTKI